MGPWLRLAVVVVAAFFSLATPARPPPPHDFPRAYPTWSPRGVAGTVGCAVATAWVAKSGKEGLGVTLRLENAREAPCAVELRDARLVLPDRGDGQPVARARPEPAALTLALGEVAHVYVPLAFDHERAWNAAGGRLRAELTIVHDAGEWRVAFEETRQAPHRRRRRAQPSDEVYLEP